MNSDPAYTDYVDPTYLHYCDDEEHDDPQPGRGVAAARSTSVHPSQSTVILTAEPLTTETANRKDTLFRFRRPDHWHAYTRTLEVLGMRHSTEKQHRRLALCGAHATIWHSPSTDQVRVQAYHCGLRCCPRCREAHASRTRTTLGRFLALVPRNRLSMITLTTGHDSRPLCEQIDGLYASFRRLRTSRIWKDSKPKGYAVLEITHNTDRNEWHPHLHLLAETPYMPHAALREAWTAATKGTASIVDIRRVNRHSVERYQHYLTDYLTKPATAEILDSKPLLTEWIDGLTHRKILIRFGRPKLADEPAKPTDPQDWSLIGSLIGLLAGLARGNSRATYWLSRLGQDHVKETRDVDAGKDYSLSPEYASPNEQFF